MIEFKKVSKVYANNKVAVEDVNLKFETGEFICIIGSSGSGKTTCLRMINRMNLLTSGSILINGRDIRKMNPVELRRQIGYVIQQIGLMPHMNIYDNIAMVPRLLKWSEDKIQETIKELMKKVNLPESFLDSYPTELSGGQQQRVGVIRALAANQEIILMDEPFGALDPITRANLQNLIKKIQKDMKRTVVFVTHDMDEALQLSDRIVIMDKGKVIQFDTPQNIMQHPANDFVKDMIGKDRLNQATFDYETVDTIMMKSPVTINYDAHRNDALKLMRKRHVDTLFVVDNSHNLIGFVDIFNVEKIRETNKPISEYVKETTCMNKNTLIRDAIYYINHLGYRNIPVIDDDGKLLGLITRASIVDFICSGFWGDYEPSDEAEAVLSKIDVTDFEGSKDD
ncbi:MAG: ABC transporter ATP-binding protein [Coprobacillus sp.]